MKRSVLILLIVVVSFIVGNAIARHEARFKAYRDYQRCTVETAGDVELCYSQFLQ